MALKCQYFFISKKIHWIIVPLICEKPFFHIIEQKHFLMKWGCQHFTLGRLAGERAVYSLKKLSIS